MFPHPPHDQEGSTEKDLMPWQRELKRHALAHTFMELWNTCCRDDSYRPCSSIEDPIHIRALLWDGVEHGHILVGASNHHVVATSFSGFFQALDFSIGIRLYIASGAELVAEIHYNDPALDLS
jgi:hypothetical protein